MIYHRSGNILETQAETNARSNIKQRLKMLQEK